MLRTHNCGELRKEHTGEKVVLCGWIASTRDHGGISFINLRDRYGITQAVITEKTEIPKSDKLNKEYCIQAEGIVKERPESLQNKSMNTGEIELELEKITILNRCKTLPLDMEEDAQVTETTRLKYRFLDLRKHKLQDNLIKRHQIMQSARNFLSEKGFLELETPMLVKPTPEGARDYIVPSRINKGRFYSLPQSPQIYKQLLMVSGFDKYFQIARCLRDEDLRADRQPEFTQIDVEMSFPEQEDILIIGEQLCKQVVEDVFSKKIDLPIERIPYEKAIEEYGCDKPDLRFGMKLKDITEIVKKSEFGIFKNADHVKCIVSPKDHSRKEIDKLTEKVKVHKAKGLAYLKVSGGNVEGPIEKFLSEDIKKELTDALEENLTEFDKIKNNDDANDDKKTIFFVADHKKIVNDSLSSLRNHLGKELNLYDSSELKFCWIVDFPLFEWDEEMQDWTPAHHMFTMPHQDTLEFLEKDPGRVIAQCYDLVLNGVELASGSIRVHEPELQTRIMKAMGIDELEARKKFGFMLDAFEYGAPPHGGFAIGFDRFIAILCGAEGNDIREVIAFPKNKNAECPMDGSPSEPDLEALKHLGLEIKKTEKKN